MFKSAVVKLTLFYVALLVLVCIIFSVPAYSISSDRIMRGSQNQMRLYRELVPHQESTEDDNPFDPDGSAYRRIQNQVEEDKRELLLAIFIVNSSIILLGAFFCYKFAQKTLKPIEQAHKAQAKFTADASHELRTPLAVMKTEIEVALQNKKASEQNYKETLESNLEEIERLQALSDQLLSLTKISSSTPKELFDFSKVVTDEVESLERKNSITVVKNIEPNITIEGNPQLCSELIHILINNAIQYSKDDNVKIEVTLVTNQSGRAMLSVKDYGIGISENDISHIFDRFYRGKASKKTSGHGLGLSIAQEIASQHGTKLNVQSVLGEYTIFSVAF